MKRKRSLWPAKKEHEIIDLISDDEEQEPVANYQRTVGDEQTPAKLPRKRKPQVDRRPNEETNRHRRNYLGSGSHKWIGGRTRRPTDTGEIT